MWRMSTSSSAALTSSGYTPNEVFPWTSRSFRPCPPVMIDWSSASVAGVIQALSPPVVVTSDGVTVRAASGNGTTAFYRGLHPPVDDARHAGGLVLVGPVGRERLHAGEDRPVAGTAAQIPVEHLLDAGLGGVRLVLKERGHVHDEAGGAVAALGSVVRREPVRDRVDPLGLGIGVRGRRSRPRTPPPAPWTPRAPPRRLRGRGDGGRFGEPRGDPAGEGRLVRQVRRRLPARPAGALDRRDRQAVEGADRTQARVDRAMLGCLRLLVPARQDDRAGAAAPWPQPFLAPVSATSGERR